MISSILIKSRLSSALLITYVIIAFGSIDQENKDVTYSTDNDVISKSKDNNVGKEDTDNINNNLPENTKSEYSISNGMGIIMHESAKDWNKSYTAESVGEKVWKFCNDNPNATKLVITIIDDCKDMKGNKSRYESKIVCNRDEIKEFATYQDSYSFNKNCMDWGIKLFDWKPCGSHLVDTGFD